MNKNTNCYNEQLPGYKLKMRFSDKHPATAIFDLLLKDSNKRKVITITPGDMITVGCKALEDYTHDELDALCGDYEQFDCYDLSDGNAYWLNSEYSQCIAEALMMLIAVSKK